MVDRWGDYQTIRLSDLEKGRQEDRKTGDGGMDEGRSLAFDDGG
jgi:hypothetical protein